MVAGHGDRGQASRPGGDHVGRSLDEEDPLWRLGGWVGDEPEAAAGDGEHLGAAGVLWLVAQ